VALTASDDLVPRDFREGYGLEEYVLCRAMAVAGVELASESVLGPVD